MNKMHFKLNVSRSIYGSACGLYLEGLPGLAKNNMLASDDIAETTCLRCRKSSQYVKATLKELIK